MQSACAVIYCHLWPSVSTIFSTLSHKLHDLRETYIVHKICILIFSKTFCNTSLYKKNSARCYYRCKYVFMYSTCYASQILMKLEFSRQIFEKYSSIKFHKNSSSGNRFVSCGWTDQQTDMTKQIVAFRNFSNAAKKKKKSPHLRDISSSRFLIFLWETCGATHIRGVIKQGAS
jgi:hypothetical protein